MESKCSVDFSSLLAFGVLGCSFDSFIKLSTAEKNEELLTQISIFVSVSNKEFFHEKLQEKLPANLLNFLHISDKPFLDSFCRASFFFVKIGPFKINILQPGSVMFLSGMKEGPLAVEHNNSQQNGPILGTSCALFLAKFLTNLASKYQEICSCEKSDCNNFFQEFYKKSLVEVLTEFSYEDAKEHGRLMEIKKNLLGVCQEKVIKLEEAEKRLFELKAVSEAKGFELKGEKLENVSKLFLNEEETKKLKELKRKERYFEGIKEIIEEKENAQIIAEELLGNIKINLLKKKNIFKDENTVRTQLEYFFMEIEKTIKMSEKMIKSTDLTESTNSINFSNEKIPKVSVELTQKEIEEQYKIKDNDRLFEYYCCLKKRIEALFITAMIADYDVFQLKSSSLVDILEVLSEIIPEVGSLFTGAGIVLKKWEEFELKRKFMWISEISGSHKNIAEGLARKITILKRNYIMNIGKNINYFLDNDYSKLFKKTKKFSEFMKKLKTKNCTPPEALAIKDSKIIETSCLVLLETGKLNPKKEESSEKIIDMIVEQFKNVHFAQHLSPELKENEQPECYERPKEFLIADSIFQKNPNFPVFLKKMPGENSEEYEKRTRNFLIQIPKEQFYDILGKIDPQDKEQYHLFKIALEAKKQRNKKCEIF